MRKQSPPNQNNTTCVDFVFDISKKSYTIVDNWIFAADLTVHEKIVYIVLKKFAIDPSRIFPSHFTIAHHSSLSVRTVQRALNSLFTKKLITMKSGQSTGRSNIYLLHSPTKIIEDGPEIPQIIKGKTDRYRGKTDRYRGKTDRHRGKTDRHRGKTDRHTIITINTIIKKLQQQMLCFSCGKESNKAKIQLDIENNKTLVCDFCLSKYIIPTSFLPLPQNSITKIRKSFSIKKVYEAVDIINLQYESKEIKNYQGLLMKILGKDIIPPTNYIPYFERVIIQEEKNKSEKISKQKAKEIEMKEKFHKEETLKKYTKLPAVEKLKIENEARSNLSQELQDSKWALDYEILKILEKDE